MALGRCTLSIVCSRGIPHGVAEWMPYSLRRTAEEEGGIPWRDPYRAIARRVPYLYPWRDPFLIARRETAGGVHVGNGGGPEAASGGNSPGN